MSPPTMATVFEMLSATASAMRGDDGEGEAPASPARPGGKSCCLGSFDEYD